MESADIVQQLQESLEKVLSARDAALAGARSDAQRTSVHGFYDSIGERLQQAKQALEEALSTADNLQKQAAAQSAVTPPPPKSSPSTSIAKKVVPIDEGRGARLRTALVDRYFTNKVPAADEAESIGREDWEAVLDSEPEVPSSEPRRPARPRPPVPESESIGRDEWEE